MNTTINNKVLLRALEPEDIDVLYKWENDRTIWHVSNTITPFSKYILRKYIENSYQDIYEAKQLRLMIELHIEDNCRTIGSIDLFDFDPHNKRAGIGILIGEPEERGKGYARIALKELISYAFDVLKLHQLYCNISADNDASISLFKKEGFQLIGVKKEWIKTSSGYSDELLFQLIRS
ncbi:MAG: GNAT family N-acetyltransferase [Bacteroidales bacterium]|nr:GNAT family N-acetyltransferase [Bacteroidales bacterium]